MQEFYNIDLVNAIEQEEAGLSWILPWAHMMGACAQIQSATLEESLAKISPTWLGHLCQSNIRRYLDQHTPDIDITCRKETWMVDRMLLEPLDKDSADALATSKDTVVLQVSLCFLCF